MIDNNINYLGIDYNTLKNYAAGHSIAPIGDIMEDHITKAIYHGVLLKFKYNQSKSAAYLRVNRGTFRKRIKRMGLL